MPRHPGHPLPEARRYARVALAPLQVTIPERLGAVEHSAAGHQFVVIMTVAATVTVTVSVAASVLDAGVNFLLRLR